MHRSRRPDNTPYPSLDLDAPVTLGDVQRYAAQALQVTPRIVAPGEHVDVAAQHGAEDAAAYRVRAVGSGDALVIQHRRHADLSPFSGLLVTRAPSGMPPRVLFDMGPLVEGSIQLMEACKMLDAVVQHASVR